MGIKSHDQTTETRVIVIWAALCLVGAAHAFAEATDWFDPSYQYRVPVEVTADAPGWQRIGLSAAQINDAVNDREELKYDPAFFAYNHLKVVDADGNVVERGGFYLVPVGAELMTAPLTGQDQTIEIPTEKDAYYLGSFVAEGSDQTPHHCGPALRYRAGACHMKRSFARTASP